MRSLRRCLLVLVATCAAAMATAPASSAVEVSNEAAQTHCPAVVLENHTVEGGCAFNGESIAPIEIGSPLGMRFCDWTLEGRLDETGNGYLYANSLSGANCNVTACEEDGGQTPMPFEVSGSAPTWDMEVQFCWILFGFAEVNCHVADGWLVTDGHSQGLRPAGPTDSHAACEGGGGHSIEGVWAFVEDVAHESFEVSE
jgi:hypothetical protein